MIRDPSCSHHRASQGGQVRNSTSPSPIDMATLMRLEEPQSGHLVGFLGLRIMVLMSAKGSGGLHSPSESSWG